jgi:hypothetical protein
MWQKVHETSPQPVKAGHGGTHLSSSYSGSINRRLTVQVGLDINVRAYLKINQIKKGLGVRFK